jgi:TPR repeat protein
MRHNHLQSSRRAADDRKAGSMPPIWALRVCAYVALLACALFTLGCKDEYPGLTAEELQSDTLPDFDDATFTGTWIMDGDYVSFELEEHGSYLLRSLKNGDGEEKDEPIPFKLKRTGELLMMEYSLETDSGHVYRPCVIAIRVQAMELDCLIFGKLLEMGAEFETQKAGNEEWKVIREPQEGLRQFYREQANNPKVFEPSLRMTRPQPARMARWKRQALRGNAEVQERLATAYQKGEIVARDKDEAAKWARKAAESGRASAQVLYGDLLTDISREQQNTTEDENLRLEVFSWYQRAADQAYPRAFGRLGHIYENAMTKNESLAVENYRRGAELGDPDSTAQLGINYYYGSGVPQNEREALRYLELVPEAERASNAWETLARIYLYALDPDQRNPTKALHAAEESTREFHGSESLELLARASFENAQYERAVKYQARAISMAGDRIEERKETLAYYQTFVPEVIQIATTKDED